MKKDLKGTMKPGAIYKKSIPEIWNVHFI